MANTPKFKAGDKILCFHGPLIYEAKCLKHKYNEENKLHEYLIHYQRWSKKWDEWVPESRMLKYTEQNLQKQQELKEQQGVGGKRCKSGQRLIKAGSKELPATPKSDVKSEDDLDSRCSTPSAEPKASRSRAKKRMKTPVQQESKETTVATDTTVAKDVANESTTENQPANESIPMEVGEIKEENIPSPEPHVETKPPVLNITANDVDFINESPLSNPNNIRLEIPAVLEKWLVEDWIQVTQSSARYLTLPAEITVSEILARYESYLKETTPADQHGENHKNVRDIEALFNKALGMHLLLKWERPQYSDLLTQYPGRQASRIYGAHHFLRLFDKLSRVLSQFPKESNMAKMLDICSPVIQYLAKNSEVYFKMSNFTIPSAEYQRRALM